MTLSEYTKIVTEAVELMERFNISKKNLVWMESTPLPFNNLSGLLVGIFKLIHSYVAIANRFVGNSTAK